MKSDRTNYWTRILQDVEVKREPIDVPDYQRWAAYECREIDDEKAITDYLNDIPESEWTERTNHIVNQLRSLIDKIEEVKTERLRDLIRQYERLISEGVPSAKPEKKQYFTPEEVITITGKSKNTIYSHLSSGKLQATKDKTGLWVITREALEDYTKRTDF